MLMVNMESSHSYRFCSLLTLYYCALTPLSIKLLILLLSSNCSIGSPPYVPISSANSTNNETGQVLPANGTSTSTAVKAFSEPLNSNATPTATRISSLFSSEMINRLVQNYHTRVTTNDPLHEDYYTRRRLGDNVWFNIERVLPFKMFATWLVNTSRITDRYDAGKDKSLINEYIQKPEIACAPETVFQLSNDVIMDDDKNRRAKMDSAVAQWHAKNKNTPPQKMCNRFRGLQCSAARKVCECENDRMYYVAYTRTKLEQQGLYRDGCYVKAWKSCSHLSLDSNIPSEYKSYHAHPNNMKQFLIRMATPMPKMARCERGSYCVDLILNQKRPICWCSSRQYSKVCYNTNGSIPMLDRFLAVRKAFHQMMIVERDRETMCTVDRKLDDTLRQIQVLSENTEKNFIQIYRLMKETLTWRGKGMRFCDFRKGMTCDPYKKICTYIAGCGPGRVFEVVGGNKKVCKVNNGYPCPTLDLQCVKGAECKDFGQGKHCHCTDARFGDLCRFQTTTFFGTLLQSRVSGFVGFHFVNLQEVVNHVLTPLERLMTLGYGKSCNPTLDRYVMNVIRYLGNVRGVVLDQMDSVLGSVQYLVGRDEQLCDYKSFLGCASVTSVCEPMVPDVALYETQTLDPRKARGAGGAGKPLQTTKVILSLRDKARCGGPGNFTNIPAVYQDLIHVQCLSHHICRRMYDEEQTTGQERYSGSTRYCLCPVGFQGLECKEKVLKVQTQRLTRIDVYELPAPVVVGEGQNVKGKHYHRGVIGR